MVAVCEHIIVKHQASAAFATNVVVSSFHNRWSIHIREKGFDCACNAIGATESADNAGFGERVFLLLLARFVDFALTRGCRQQSTITPVGMCRQNFVRVYPRALNVFENILSVCGRSRPVHELMWDKGAFVEHINAEVVRKVSGQSRILVRSHIPR